MCEADTLSIDPAWLARAEETVRKPQLGADLAEREKALIEEALRESDGGISGPAGAAARLGIPRQTLQSKIRKLGINRRHFRA